MRTTISTKGQIVLPAELREADGIKPGEEFEGDRIGPDAYRLTRVTPPPERFSVPVARLVTRCPTASETSTGDGSSASVLLCMFAAL